MILNILMVNSKAKRAPMYENVKSEESRALFSSFKTPIAGELVIPPEMIHSESCLENLNTLTEAKYPIKIALNEAIIPVSITDGKNEFMILLPAFNPIP